jgi:hypothetical protein
VTTPAVAAYVPTYATRTPYLTRAEFLAAPTGVDTTQLVPGGSANDNGAALDQVLAAASSYADTLCDQVLAATSDVQVGEYRVFRDGTIRVPVDYTPLIAVTGVLVGWQAGGLQALTDLSGLWLQRKVVRIPITLYPALDTRVAAVAGGGRMFAQVTYVNGYTNTTLTAQAVSGTTSLTVASPLGVFPGLPLTVLDGAGTELVTVASTYVQGSTTVPLTTALASTHIPGVAVSALPRAIKQAVICLAAHIIKTRGAESLSLSGVSGGPALQQSTPGYTEEYEQAVDLLRVFRRTA